MDCPVVRVLDSPEGLAEFRVRDSRGHRIMLIQVSSADLDDELMQDIHDWADRHAHEALHLMPPSASAAS